MGKKKKDFEYQDLDILSGTWGEKDVAEFEANTAVFTLLIQKIREFRKGHSLEGMNLREMIEEGRRF
jgi:hypothetical protein